MSDTVLLRGWMVSSPYRGDIVPRLRRESCLDGIDGMRRLNTQRRFKDGEAQNVDGFIRSFRDGLILDRNFFNARGGE